MAKKNIAIDLNDVIRATTEKILDVYKRNVDITCELEVEDITDFDLSKVLNFKSYDDYANFRFIEYAYEIYCRAELVDDRVIFVVNNWIENTLNNLDEENVPFVSLFSPFESNIAIRSTMNFLMLHTLNMREFYFPKDSITVFDKADIIITANPNLITACPDGKTVVKINMPYNKDVSCELSYDSIIDMIQDEDEKIIKLLEE